MKSMLTTTNNNKILILNNLQKMVIIIMIFINGNSIPIYIFFLYNIIQNFIAMSIMIGINL